MTIPTNVIAYFRRRAPQQNMILKPRSQPRFMQSTKNL